MKIEDQVCTLEQAKRLKELGVEQQSAFIHIFYVDDFNLQTFEKSYRHEVVFTNWNIDAFKKLEWYSAFTVAELGVMLLSHFKVHKYHNDSWQFTTGTSDWKDFVIYKKEAEARAARLLYLLENNLITAEEVNKKLTLNKK